MDSVLSTNSEVAAPSRAQEHLSYKFERLRESLRQAILSGELSGKLPGERELGRRFHANPKTLSKALTDLAAEGLLERSIGRGTFVRGSAAAPGVERQARWLVLADDQQASAPLIEQIKQLHTDLEVVASSANLRPSFISQFSAVIDLAKNTPERFHRSLLVRGVALVLVNRQPGSFKTHAVLFDKTHAAWTLGRDLFLGGHRQVLVVEEPGSTVVSDALRLAAARYAPQASVESCPPQSTLILSGQRSVLVCDGPAVAQQIQAALEQQPPLSRPSLAALGLTSQQPGCTGIYVNPAELAQAAIDLLDDTQVRQPTVVYLSGTYADRATTRVLPERVALSA